MQSQKCTNQYHSSNIVGQLVAELKPKIPWLKNLCVAVWTRILPDFALWNADFELLLQHPAMFDAIFEFPQFYVKAKFRLHEANEPNG